MVDSSFQYLTDHAGNAVAVVIPIEVWREIESERETAYLLRSDAMKQRLLAAKNRTEGLTFDDARAKLGI